jgi:hypothetical protein
MQEKSKFRLRCLLTVQVDAGSKFAPLLMKIKIKASRATTDVPSLHSFWFFHSDAKLSFAVFICINFAFSRELTCLFRGVSILFFYIILSEMMLSVHKNYEYTFIASI